ncbi:MAG: glycerol-3-phosphate 1-O-acyltransferase PlsB [Pseudomonadota bacterium]
MLKYLGIDRPLLYAARKLMYGWVRTQVLPQDGAALALTPDKPVIYVLQRRFLSNLLVLSREAETLGLPPALKSFAGGAIRAPRSFFFTSRPEPWFGSKKPAPSEFLRKLVEGACQDPAFDVQLVPVSILWGRAPDKEDSFWQLLFSDGWAKRGSLRQMFTLLLHGRQTLVRFSEPLSLHALIEDRQDPDLALRKVARVLRRHFRRQREMTIGPDLSHRRTRINALMEAGAVQAAIEAEAQAAGGGPKAALKAQQVAHGYAMEIAADYSYPLVRIASRFLTWLWTRLYDGVELSNFDTVTSVASDHEIVYLPCHRSHIDYLLLSYLVFSHGLMVPHIAAGANLNLPVVGGILRRGGAFFLRRSFKGNKVYAAVFNEYLHMMITKGYPIEYFVEGGRSRTGRLLAPMPGMLGMTVQSYLRDASRPIVFLPVYIGYEKLFEGRTYVGELMGRPKKKESLLDLLLTVRELKKNFGKVHVNFGEPIKLADILGAHNPDWRSAPHEPDVRPPWVVAGVEQLMRQIAVNINGAAVINPVNLVSLVLLGTPRHAMDARQLERQLDACRQLALALPYSARTQLSALDGAAMIAYCEQLKLLQRQAHPLGDILHFYPDDAVLSTYARNNILHLYALPALIAFLVSHNALMRRPQLLRLAHTVYPFLRAELFLRWSERELNEAIDQQLGALAALGWLEHSEIGDSYAAPALNSDEYAQLSLLGQAIRPTLMRYFITLATLTQHGSGTMTPAELESQCHLQAQRLSLLREFNAPEFFDKVIFRTFIDTLKKTGYAQVAEDGSIHFDERLDAAASEARAILPPDVRQAVLHMTRVDGVVERKLANG